MPAASAENTHHLLCYTHAFSVKGLALSLKGFSPSFPLSAGSTIFVQLVSGFLQLLPEEVPGKAGGPPGNAFELVYGHMTDAVRRAVRKVDPVLADWIR